jgi:hypothetical protein
MSSLCWVCCMVSVSHLGWSLNLVNFFYKVSSFYHLKCRLWCKYFWESLRSMPSSWVSLWWMSWRRLKRQFFFDYKCFLKLWIPPTNNVRVKQKLTPSTFQNRFSFFSFFHFPRKKLVWTGFLRCRILHARNILLRWVCWTLKSDFSNARKWDKIHINNC